MRRNSKSASPAGHTAGKLALATGVALGLVACGGGGTPYSAPDPTATAAKVSLFSPVTAVAGVATTYLVNGANLPATVVVSLAEGSCATPTNVTSTSFSVVCTAGSVAGAKAMMVKTDLDAKGGWWIGQQALVVTAAPRAASLVADTGITAK